MQLVRLGEVYSTSYVPDMLIEGYSSCIWTERFYGDGDFEIRTPHIEATRALLPEDTLVSHLETDEVMMVDTHMISTDNDGTPELVVQGRSLTSIFTHRFVQGPYGKRRKMRRGYNATGAAAVLMWNAIDNGSGKDVTRGDPTAEVDKLNDYSWNTLDKIPNVSITDSVANDGNVRRWWLEEGELYPQLLRILTKRDLGIRTIRPTSGSSAQIITVKTALADRGEVVRTYTENINSLRFDIYDGLDRTDGQSTNPRVIFSVLQGDLDRANYLFSRKDFKTIVEVSSSVKIDDIYRNNTESSFTGIRRRSMHMDAGQPEIPDEPEKPEELRKNATKAEKDARAVEMDKWLDDHAKWKNKRDKIVSEFKEDAAEDAKDELKRLRPVKMLSGDISELSPYKFKTHYNLGDKVTLYGDYNQTEDMIVSEYIRTEDAEGDRGYPGLVMP